MLIFIHKEANKRAVLEGREEILYKVVENCDFKNLKYSDFGLQYLYEIQDWHYVNKVTSRFAYNEIKLSKKHIQTIEDSMHFLNTPIIEEKSLSVVKIIQDIIAVMIITIMAARRYKDEPLIKQTGTRHALITEILFELEKLFVYRDKQLDAGHKKTFTLLIITLIDFLVETKIINQEIYQHTNIDYAKMSNKNTDIEEENLTIPKFKESNNHQLKTIYIYSMAQKIILDINITYGNISIIPLTQIIKAQGTIYQMGATLRTIQKVTLENKYSNKHIILNDVTILNRLKELKFFINKELYGLVLSKISLEQKNLTPYTVIKHIRETIKQLKIPVYVPPSKTEENDTKRAGIVNRNKTNKKFKVLQKIINKHLIILDFLMLENYSYMFERPLYFYYMFDFRGRLYYKSKISPQNTYLFRYIYDYGPEYTSAVNLSIPLNIDYKYGYKIIKQSTGFEEQHGEKEQRMLFWLIIEFAKLVKTANVDTYCGVFTIQDFVQLGLQTSYCSAMFVGDLEKNIQYSYIKYIGEKLINSKRLDRRYIIYKDATASAIQLLTAYLTPVDQTIAERANLLSNTQWYDTYYFIIYMFKQEVKIAPESEPYFTRSYLKKTIMTYNYAATLYTCGLEFENLIKNEQRELLKESLNKIKYDFKTFYNYLDTLFNKQSIFIDSLELKTQSLILSYEEKKQISIQGTDKAIIYLHYLITETKRWSLQAQKKRKTVQMWELKDKLDVKKTRQAIKPNTTHAMDAALVRETLCDLLNPIVTIHDCYGTILSEIDEVIYSINKNINLITTHEKGEQATQGFSIFIIL